MASGAPLTALSISQPQSPKLKSTTVPRLIKEDPKDSIELDLNLNSSVMSANVRVENSNSHTSPSPIPPKPQSHPPSPSQNKHRSSKRSNSTSNDLLYERDRFRARLHNFNIASDDHIDEDEGCEVCDIIGSKTTKLNVKKDHEEEQELVKTFDTLSPLDENSKFFQGLPTVLLANNLMSVKLIEFKDLKYIFNWYFNKPLPPTTSMFPWLHGLHLDNFAQRRFFIQQQQQQQQQQQHSVEINDDLIIENIDSKPKARFLMTINSDILNNTEPILKNNILVNEILCPIDISKAEVKDLINNILMKCFGNTDLFEIIFEDVYKINYLPIFLNLDPDRGVSLRNFHIQVTKLAICSDLIIYCFNEHDLTYCHSLTRLFWLAQKIENLENNNDLKFNIFIMKHFSTSNLNIADDKIFSVSLKTKINKNYEINKIIKLSLNYLNNWDNEYTIKEKIETLKMSSATKLIGNLFCGNSWDYQNFLNFRYSNLQDYLIDKKSIDFNNLYCNPSNSIITSNFKINDLIETILPLPNLNYKLFINCFNEACFPDATNLENFLKLFHKSDALGDYYHLSFPSSGSIGFGDIKRENIISILNTVKLIYLVSVVKKIDLLIYCSDGYTELSLLNLCFIIYANNCSLNDAIIDFHLKYGRPFYIFNTDVQIISKLEPILRKFSPKNRATNWEEFENITTLEMNEMLLSRKTLLNSSVSSPNSIVSNNYSSNFHFNNNGYHHQSDCFDANSSSSDSSVSSSLSVDDSLSNPEPEWSKEVEGSLPSRILPYLYLGSLKHANCLPLLSRLGIKKIISVGEPLEWLSGSKFQKEHDIIIDELNNGDIELYNITAQCNSHHQYPSLTVDQVMKVNNLQDDGIDQLESSLPTILQYIDDEYRKSNGQTKILIHCRVGVSRSATVAIAEVMRRLKVNLPKAYLYVRVRRLNIIIQPNLKFMYEIFKWEEIHKQNKSEYLREIDWFSLCREITLLNTPYLTN